MPSLVRRQCLRLALYLSAKRGRRGVIDQTSGQRKITPSPGGWCPGLRPRLPGWQRLLLSPHSADPLYIVSCLGCSTHRILLSVLKRNHGAMGLFCLAFLASFFLMANDFWDGCKKGS